MTVSGVAVVRAIPFREFLDADERRASSFITNFGDWRLPEAVARELGSDVAHLEWFHDTGELVAIGAVPETGSGAIEVSAAEGVVGVISDVFPFGAAGTYSRFPDGAVREVFPAMVVPDGTRAAVLAVIGSGPRVHALLWGWHLQRRKADGWEWLSGRLARQDDSEVEAEEG